ncbi:helix-turn-helix transcriptional regulator [Halopenitus sp. H-Gu1]|uniref:helix-turn-helix transcriptional regulator n=1 Tax=Halopenitus sp. H-Gu1 TaxID=3242697 RepID=UPI00359EC622
MGIHASVRTDRVRRVCFVAFTAFLAVSFLAVLVIPGGSGTATALDLGGGSVAAQDIDADRVTLRAKVLESGNAAWRIEYRTRLDTDDREAAFEDLQEDVRQNESTYTDRFRSRMQSSADAGATATGRSMTIRDVSVETQRRELPEAYGVLIYEFEWTNFAVVSDDRITAGDAIAGLFLEEEQRLTLAWPESHDLQNVRPTPDETRSDSVTWTGPTDFANDEPHIETAPSGVLGTGIGWLPIAIALVVVLVFLAIVMAYRHRGRDRRSLAGGDSGEVAESPVTEPETEREDEFESKPGGDTGSGAAVGSEAEELLSNEERVLRLLREHGGRMKQQDVVQTLGWTDARTSQIVSDLRDEGKLESFRLGRENVLRLPEADTVDLAEGDTGGEDADDGRDHGDRAGDGEADG